MQHPDFIIEIEEAAREIGVPMARILRKADVHETTWHRWKTRKTSPTVERLGLVRAALEQFRAEPAQAGAAE